MSPEARKAYDAMLAALKEAREDMQHWASFAGEYFKDKHDLEADLKKIDAAIAEGERH